MSPQKCHGKHHEVYYTHESHNSVTSQAVRHHRHYGILGFLSQIIFLSIIAALILFVFRRMQARRAARRASRPRQEHEAYTPVRLEDQESGIHAASQFTRTASPVPSLPVASQQLQSSNTSLDAKAAAIASHEQSAQNGSEGTSDEPPPPYDASNRV
ncbi:hypothetical protein V1512DRAFT_246183 [Lipomyces arxii]|uniref:uncharacterized protein n=1 Tax=Lipomyces arxii TaxID=56418 RepID=UPI0034CEFD09